MCLIFSFPSLTVCWYMESCVYGLCGSVHHTCVCVHVCMRVSACVCAYTVHMHTRYQHKPKVLLCVCALKVTIIRYWDHQDVSMYMYVCVAVYTCFIISQTCDAATLTSKPMALGIMFINYVCAGVWHNKEVDQHVPAGCKGDGVSCWAEVCSPWSCS